MTTQGSAQVTRRDVSERLREAFPGATLVKSSKGWQAVLPTETLELGRELPGALKLIERRARKDALQAGKGAR